MAMIYNESGNGGNNLENSELLQEVKINKDILKISFTLNNGKDYYGAIQLSTQLLMEIIEDRMKHKFEKINQIS